MEIDPQKLPTVLTDDVIQKILSVYETARFSQEWRQLSEGMSQSQLDQIFKAIKDRDEKRAKSQWKELSQEERDKRIRGSQAIYFNRWSEGVFLKDVFSKTSVKTIVNRDSNDKYKVACWEHELIKCNSYTFFQGSNSPFAMCYPSQFIIENRIFYSAQQFIMYSKAKIFMDLKSLKEIYDAKSDFLSIGREVKFFDKKVWQGNLVDLMRVCLKQKFLQNPDLLEILRTTRTDLIVCVDKNRFWGTGGFADSNSTEHGLNMIGNLLTELRIELFEGEYN